MTIVISTPHTCIRYSHLPVVMHLIIISASAPNAYINLWTSIIKYSTLNAKCNGQQCDSWSFYIHSGSFGFVI